jgi:hypothetical protein
MALPNSPVTLTVEQIDQLSLQISNMRHEINNHLSLVVASAELIRIKPETLERMLGIILEQSPKIQKEVISFSDEFEKTLGITRKSRGAKVG